MSRPPAVKNSLESTSASPRVTATLFRDPLGIGTPWSGRHFNGTTGGKPSWRSSPIVAALRIVLCGAALAGLIYAAISIWFARV